MIADIAIGSDECAGQDVRKGPHTGLGADVDALDEGLRVLKEFAYESSFWLSKAAAEKLLAEATT